MHNPYLLPNIVPTSVAQLFKRGIPPRVDLKLVRRLLPLIPLSEVREWTVPVLGMEASTGVCEIRSDWMDSSKHDSMSGLHIMLHIITGSRSARTWSCRLRIHAVLLDKAACFTIDVTKEESQLGRFVPRGRRKGGSYSLGCDTAPLRQPLLT